jgi:hypothetical protein
MGPIYETTKAFAWVVVLRALAVLIGVVELTSVAYPILDLRVSVWLWTLALCFPLFLPWQLIRQRAVWTVLFAILCANTALVVFTLVASLVRLFGRAASEIPALNILGVAVTLPTFAAVSLFVAAIIALQIPAVLTLRRQAS